MRDKRSASPRKTRSGSPWAASPPASSPACCLPSTRMEDERVGPIADQVKEKAIETGQEAMERGKEVAGQVAEQAAETAKERGPRSRPRRWSRPLIGRGRHRPPRRQADRSGPWRAEVGVGRPEPARQGRRPGAGRRQALGAGRLAREEPAAPVRRPGPPQPPGNERLLARVSAGSGVAEAGRRGLGGAARRASGKRSSSVGRRCGCCTASALRRDPQLASLGPDILAADFDLPRPSDRSASPPSSASATRCSTSGGSPASATSSRARPASPPASTPGAGRRAGGRGARAGADRGTRADAGGGEHGGRHPAPSIGAPAVFARLAACRLSHAAKGTPIAPRTGARAASEFPLLDTDVRVGRSAGRGRAGPWPSGSSVASPPAVWRRVPWRMVWAVAVWLVEQGRERVQRNLSKKERQELLRLVEKSKGRPALFLNVTGPG